MNKDPEEEVYKKLDKWQKDARKGEGSRKTSTPDEVDKAQEAIKKGLKDSDKKGKKGK